MVRQWVHDTRRWLLLESERVAQPRPKSVAASGATANAALSAPPRSTAVDIYDLLRALGSDE